MTDIEALIGAMTLDEKVGQLNMLCADFVVTGPILSPDYVEAVRSGRAGSVLNLWGAEQTREVQRIAVEESHLGIPLLVGFDVLHGHRMIFPIPLGEVAAFDPDLWERTARAAAEEAAADGIALTFAPMLDICRDPRWGRIAEGPGEDPWIGERFARAKVRGFQGDDLAAPGSIAATAKHIGAYGAVTAGRDYASVDISDRALHEVYLPPFRAAVQAGAAAIMAAFTDLAGVPATANRALLRDLVRDRWGFEGIIVSDFNAISELVVHGVAEDIADAAALALRAGIDIDMMGGAYGRGLPIALERGKISIAEVDAAVRRVLTLKLRLNLFEAPYGRTVQAGAALPKHRDLAREAACRSVVLLKNEGSVLPLPPGLRRIAMIGPLADAREEMLGPWWAAGSSADAVSFVEGLRAALPDVEIVCVRGVAIDGEDTSEIPSAVAAVRDADLVLLCLGESAAMSGEAASRACPGLPGRQRQLAEAVLALGKPAVATLSLGRPLTAPWLFEQVKAVLATWFLGSEAGNAVADVLTGRHNPSGRLPLSWPVDVGQIPIFYARRPSGRPADPAEHYSSKYIDLPTEPLFPFGHGLSYTRFAYAELRAVPDEVQSGQEITIEVEVTNVGPVPGEETVFLFVRDPVASVARPLLELKGIEKVRLASEQRRTVRFALPTESLAFLDTDLEQRLEPGLFEFFVGPSSDRRTLLRTSIRLIA